MIIPKRFENAKYEDVPKNIQNLIKDIKESRRGIYIYGTCGTGKTHISYAIAKKIEDEKFKVQFWSLPELLRFFKRDFDELNKLKDFQNSNFIQIMNYKGILIIDDIGVEKMSEWVEETLYAIINKRYEDVLPTIFTSNNSPEELITRLGDRIVSRIVGSCDIIELSGKDKRLN